MEWMRGCVDAWMRGAVVVGVVFGRFLFRYGSFLSFFPCSFCRLQMEVDVCQSLIRYIARYVTWTVRQTHRQSDRRTDSQTDGQTDRRTDRQTDADG